MRTLAPIALSLALITGCDDSFLQSNDFSELDTAAGAEMDDAVQAVNLRFDILPPEGLTNRQGDDALLEPQTFIAEIRAPLEATLLPSVWLSGEISGDAATPYAPAIATPGVEGSVPGTVRLISESPVMGSTSRIDEDGLFASLAVPGTYGFAIVPDDSTYPLYVEPAREVFEAEDAAIDIGGGHPVWGQVITEGGTPMVGVEVALRATELGVQGPSTWTDSSGRYVLYASPGQYNVVALGRDNGRDPVIASAPFALDVTGQNLDIAYGSLDLISMSGRLVTSDGGGVGGSTVRLRSQDLTGYTGSDAGVVVEIPTDGAGNFDARLVTGQYLVELLPPSESTVSAVSLGVVDVTSAIDLGAVELPAFRTVTGVATDIDGLPLSGAMIRATEVSFDRRYTSATTDSEGRYTLEVPVADLDVLLTPPGDRPDLAATRHRFALGTLEAEENLVAIEGRAISGTLRWSNLGRDEDLEFALVQVYTEAGAPLGQALTDSSGAFALQVDLQAFE